MSAAAMTKGWCPTLLSPMQSGDGWLARVKPVAATLGAAHARLLADAARRHGNGHIDLTSRANLQVRGLTPRSSELFAETIIGAGLASANSSVEAVRNVMASPLGPDDRSAPFDSHEAAREIDAALAAEPALAALPGKFGILVDGGGVLPLAGVTADIMVRAERSGIAVSLDGGVLASSTSPSKIAETVKALALTSLNLAWERREPPSRLRALLRIVGEDAIFASAGLALMPSPETAAPAVTSAVGFVPYADPALGAFGVGLPFGRIDAVTLHTLAGLSEHHGDGTLRTTPWRALLIPGIEAADADHLAAEIAALGLIADASDRRLRVHACVGAPSCLSASVDTRTAATRIAAHLADAAETIHVSGCAKSCAHRGPASVTLVGRDGRFDLVRNGSAAGLPSLIGLTLDEVLALAGAKEHAS